MPCTWKRPADGHAKRPRPDRVSRRGLGWFCQGQLATRCQGAAGRHRDRALASARKCRAIQLKLQGLTYQQIADELGYTSRGTVYKIIRTAQATQLTDAVEEHLDIEVSRLNALQAAVWPAAMSGDLQALVVAVCS